MCIPLGQICHHIANQNNVSVLVDNFGRVSDMLPWVPGLNSGILSGMLGARTSPLFCPPPPAFAR